MNINQEGFDRRLTAVQNILRQYGLESTRVSPLAYGELFPSLSINSIYKVDLRHPATPATFAGQQPCTVQAPPEGVSAVVVRMSKPYADGLNNANRVRNDVVAQHLVRQSLRAAGVGAVVPAVYAWAPCRPEAPGGTGFGWTICEFKPGEDLDGQFASLPLDEANAVLEQLADIFSAVQLATLPETVTKFGALTIDDSGAIVNGQPPLPQGGPWDSCDDYWAAKIQAQLSDADKSSLLRGWADRGIREQIDRFLESGWIKKLLKPVDVNKRVLIHGSLTLNNVLYDGSTKRITGLRNFDWARVTNPCEEFLSGLWDIGGSLQECNEKFRPMLLTGNFDVLPERMSGKELRTWLIAKAWDAALAERGVLRPSDIAGTKQILALREFANLLCPCELASDVMLRLNSKENNQALKRENEEKILAWLERHFEGLNWS